MSLPSSYEELAIEGSSTSSIRTTVLMDVPSLSIASFNWVAAFSLYLSFFSYSDRSSSSTSVYKNSFAIFVPKLGCILALFLCGDVSLGWTTGPKAEAFLSLVPPPPAGYLMLAFMLLRCLGD